MILDVPPTTANLIIQKAQEQGITVNQLLLGFAYHDVPDVMINCNEMPNPPLSEHNAQKLEKLLDEPNTPTPLLKYMLTLGEKYA